MLSIRDCHRTLRVCALTFRQVQSGQQTQTSEIPTTAIVADTIAQSVDVHNPIVPEQRDGHQSRAFAIICKNMRRGGWQDRRLWNGCRAMAWSFVASARAFSLQDMAELALDAGQQCRLELIHLQQAEQFPTIGRA